MICVSIGRTRHKMVTAEHRALAAKGAELVELRLDWLSQPPDLERLLKDRPTPCIVTCRRRVDRGRWKGTEQQRQALLRAAIWAEVEYVDLEDDIGGEIPRHGKTKRIISHHDFEETPQELEAIHAKMCDLDADIIKLVTMANSPSDIVRMLKLVAGTTVPTIGFCMGELGMSSRILCGKYGSPFTYASFSSERELAPGQLSFDEMRDVYRFDQINAETQVFGVLGDPIAQSLSPIIHNAAFRDVGLNSVYLPFRVPKDDLTSTLEAFEWLDVRGYSVTIPHKVSVLPFAGYCEHPTEEVGAANTLFRDDDGSWRAANTDYEAALSSIELGLQSDPGGAGVLQGKKVLMLGAGGVARAIGLGVVRGGGGLTIANRTHDKAVALAKQLGCQQTHWKNRGIGYADILINCTPIGMHPDVDDTPILMHWLREGMLVFDSVYNPENTLLLKQARERGCRTVTGLEMFVRQAALQFERFTGQSAPMEQMRAALRRGISPVRM
jgi:3-dehydroquinate dehydratase/shikimate dehydrogenase